MKKYIILMLTLLAGIWSCSDDDPVTPPAEPKLEITSTDKLSVVNNETKEATSTIDHKGGERRFTVESSHAWSAEFVTPVSWAQIAKANENLVINIDSFTEPEIRPCAVLVKNEAGLQFTIKIEQRGEGMASISFEKDRVIMPSKGDVIDVQIISDESVFTIADIKSDIPWIDAAIVKKSDGLHYVQIYAEKNFTGEKLSATVTVRAGESITSAEASFEVVQTNGSLVLEFVTTQDNQTIALPIMGDINIIVDWGDGSPQSTIITNIANSSYARPEHTYNTAGAYEVTISGTVDQICAYGSEKAINHLSAIIQWGDLGLKSMQQAFHSTMIETIPEVEDGNIFENVAHAGQMFFSCKNLKEIPENFLDGFVNCTIFQSAFARCESLEAIPAGLFKNTINAKECSFLFDDCPRISDIPEGLFDNLINAETFSGAFRNNTAIEYIPKDLFKNNPEAKLFAFQFEGCINLKEIPEGLFDNNPKATSFGSAFKNCTSLKSIPKGLFDKHTEVTIFGNVFEGCEQIESIPEGLFDNLKKVTRALGIFKGCTSLKSVPAGLFSNMEAATDFSQMFEGCTSLTKVDKDIFENCSAVTTYASVFNGCTSLTEVSPTIFVAAGEKVTNFSKAFMGCTKLTSIPVNIFDKNTKISNVSSIFEGCTALTGSAPYTVVDGNNIYLWNRATPNFSKIYTASKAFRDCTGLSNYDDIPTNWK